MIKYVPVLKTKTTSFRALQSLKPETKASIAPLFEIIPDTEENFAEKLTSNWMLSQPIFVDLIFIDGDEKIDKILRDTIMSTSKAGFDIIPVWGPERTLEYLKGIQQISREGISKIALRFPVSIFTSDNVDEIITKTITEANRLFSNIYIFLDMEDISDGKIQYYDAIAYLKKLNAIPHVLLGIIAGSFPDAIKLAEYKNSEGEIQRYDFDLWKRLKNSKEEFADNLVYGDYTIRDTELPFEGRIKDIIPTLRYTKESTFYIHRGISHRQHESGMRQFNALCKDLVDQPFYRKANFSEGDKAIYLKGTQQDSSPGNLATWVQIGINQHIEFVVYQISNILDGAKPH